MKYIRINILILLMLFCFGCKEFIGDSKDIPMADAPIGFAIPPKEAQQIVINRFGQSKILRKYYYDDQYYYVTPHPHGEKFIIISGQSGEILN